MSHDDPKSDASASPTDDTEREVSTDPADAAEPEPTSTDDEDGAIDASEPEGAEDPEAAGRQKDEPNISSRTIRHRINVDELNVTPKQLERLQRIVSQPWVQDYAARQLDMQRIDKSLQQLRLNLGNLTAPGTKTAVEAIQQSLNFIQIPVLPSASQQAMELQTRQRKLLEPFAADFMRNIEKLASNASLAGYATKTQEFLTTTESLRYRANRPVWHYTNGHALMSILSENCLWASNPAHLNDASELMHGFAFLQEANWSAHEDAPSKNGYDDREWNQVNGILREVLDENYFKDIIDEVYLISASVRPDTLTLWRNYADGNGFAIGLDASVELSADGLELENTSPDDRDPDGIPPISGWYRVEYKDIKKRRLSTKFIQSAITDIRRTGEHNVSAVVRELRKQAVILASVMKHEAFKDEREVRWISTNFSENFDPVHYEHGRKSIVPVLHIMTASNTEDDVLPLKGVWCSPVADDSIVRTIEGLLRQSHYVEASKKVRKSVQPFRG